MELGGNCPFIVFNDADLDQAANGWLPQEYPTAATQLTLSIALMGIKWKNNGQACISSNRIYVQAGVYDQFATLISEKTMKLVVGHGSSPDSTIGPLTTPQSIERMTSLIADAKSQGARILLGGGRMTDKHPDGYFFQPTIIGDATPEMRITSEEAFGPLLTLCKFETEEEAIRAANNTPVVTSSEPLPFLKTC